MTGERTTSSIRIARQRRGAGSRRRFLRGAGACTATAGLFVPGTPWSRPAFAATTANDRPRLGCIGVGSIGMHDAKIHVAFADVVAVCDVDRDHADRARQDEGVGKGKADAYADYRRVLDRPDVDVVSICTPDHWHVKIAIEALQAGKHVFCQKPLSLTLEESRLARAAATKYPGLQFFIGTQQRAEKDLFLRAVNMVRKGLLGDIRRVTAGIDGGPRGGPFPVAAPPATLDWEKWLGQAPKVAYRRKRCHTEFRWWYDYSGGKFTDWGAHHVDIAQWALGEDGPGKGPVEIDGSDVAHPVPFRDGFPTVDDQFNTAHDFAVRCRFTSGTELVVTSRGDNGILFEGTKGKLFVNRGKITGKPIEEQWDKDAFSDANVRELFKGKPGESHRQNFYRCVHEGGLPVSDVFSHIVAMNTCHLAAIAGRLGRKIAWDPVAEKIVGDDQAASFAARTPRPGYEIPRV